MIKLAVGLTVTGLLVSAVPASADPGQPDPVGAAPVAAAEWAPVPSPAVAAGPAGAAPAALVTPADVVRVESAPPASSTLDGVTLTISSRDETQIAVAPLTTAVSTREYSVGGVFNGAITGAATPPEGVFEVGYQIGCGIDMNTGGGVLIGAAYQGAIGSDALLSGPGGFNLLPLGLVGAGSGLAGQVAVNLKPGVIINVPVVKKNYKGVAPEVEFRDFRVKIDGCVGESFIRSYATLSRSTPQVEDVVSWFGVTKAV